MCFIVFFVVFACFFLWFWLIFWALLLHLLGRADALNWWKLNVKSMFFLLQGSTGGATAEIMFSCRLHRKKSGKYLDLHSLLHLNYTKHAFCWLLKKLKTLVLYWASIDFIKPAGCKIWTFSWSIFMINITEKAHKKYIKII